MVFTKFHMKSYKKDGELSCPFDLCVTPLEALAAILETDFEDFLDDIEYMEKGKSFINKKYSMCFPHEEGLSLEEFKSRYKKRIDNFKEVSSQKSFKKYIFNCEQNNFTIDGLNRVYNALAKLRKNKPFKFYVLNFVHDNVKKIDLTGINEEICYYEYDITKEYNNGWLGNFGWFAQNFNGDILSEIIK